VTIYRQPTTDALPTVSVSYIVVGLHAAGQPSQYGSNIQSGSNWYMDMYFRHDHT